MSYQMTKYERESFLADLHVAIMSVTAERRGPISVPVWYIYQPGGDFIFCTAKNSRKVDLIKASGRFTVCVLIEPPPSKYVSVEGRVVSIDVPDLEKDLRPIARRYLGEEKGDQYTEEARKGEELVVIRMHPERWSSADYSKT